MARQRLSPLITVVLCGLLPGLGADAPPSSREVETCLNRVRDYHGATGPWAVIGYRIGARALKDLGVPRSSHALLVVHRCPAEVQYACIADGLQAATGASPGKLNLRLVEVSAPQLATTIEDRTSRRTLTFTVLPELAKSLLDLPRDRLEAEGRRIAALPDAALFRIVEDSPPPQPGDRRAPSPPAYQSTTDPSSAS